MGKKKSKAAKPPKVEVTAEHVEAERDMRIKTLTRDLAEGDLGKKARRRAEEQLHALVERRGAFVPTSASEKAPRSSTLVPAGHTGEELDALLDRANALKSRLEADASAQPSEPSTAGPSGVYDRRDGEDEVAYQWRIRRERDQVKSTQESVDAVHQARRTIVDPDPIEQEAQEAVEVVTEDGGREFRVGTTAAPVLPMAVNTLPFEVPEDPVLADGNGRPRIYVPDPKDPTKAKLVSYTRVTTYIDCLDDKTKLVDWKMRTLLEGAHIEETQVGQDAGSVQAVGRSMERRDATLATLTQREADGDLFTVLERDAATKEHRDFANRIVENLLDLGGQHDKADTGTRLHRITELVDEGQPIPEWATASDRLDVEAYLAAKTALGLDVLWTERRVVDDELGTTGTMDRAYLWKPEGRTRRVRVVGDLKTGNVEWSAGKIGMQLAAYARGKGYVHDAESLAREDLRLSRTDALLIHLPAGEHRCSIYLVDLTLASKGLQLAASVRAWRNEGKRVYSLKAPLVAIEAPAAS